MRRVAAGVALVLAVLLAAGCSRVYREEMCQAGEYPVWAKEGGRACLDNSEEPSAGWYKYPAGHVPKYLDQDYTPNAVPTP